MTEEKEKALEALDKMNALFYSGAHGGEDILDKQIETIRTALTTPTMEDELAEALEVAIGFVEGEYIGPGGADLTGTGIIKRTEDILAKYRKNKK